jgi:hypothetical protein
LVGGPALFLLGLVAFRFRNIRTIGYPRLLSALLLLALLPLCLAVPALASIGIVCAVLGALVAWEAIRFAEARREMLERGATSD